MNQINGYVQSLSLNKWFSRKSVFAANTMRGQRGEEKMKRFENEVLILEEYDEKP